MNHIKISNRSDFSTILNEPILISGKQSMVETEIYYNMWDIDFDKVFMFKVTADDLVQFLSELLQKRIEQLQYIDPTLTATFYLWSEYHRLKFNILSGTGITLPLDDKYTVVTLPDSILDDFVTSTRSSILKDLSNADDDDEEECTNDVVLDVYVQELTAGIR